MIRLNLLKPISLAQKKIGMKCKWTNIEAYPVKNNVMPQSQRVGAKPHKNVLTLGYPLTEKNINIFETIIGNDKIFKSPFVKVNLSKILKAASTKEGAEMMQSVLTPEVLQKLDVQRCKISKNPRVYIKDKVNIKYINTPSGLGVLFGDINMLKAAAVLDKESLDKLFRMDVTQGAGKKVLDKIGEMNLKQLNYVKKRIANSQDMQSFEKIYFAQMGKSLS